MFRLCFVLKEAREREWGFWSVNCTACCSSLNLEVLRSHECVCVCVCMKNADECLSSETNTLQNKYMIF